MRPLDGVRVLELGQYISGPYCSMLLADQGADVIKVERPETGDPRRSYDPLVTKDGQSTSGGFLSYNRNKRSVALNLRDPRGQKIFAELAERCDVIVENLRPGVMDTYGLAPQELCTRNPRLIYAAISGYGRDPLRRGPFSDRPAFDAAIQATTGIMSVTGQLSNFFLDTYAIIRRTSDSYFSDFLFARSPLNWLSKNSCQAVRAFR